MWSIVHYCTLSAETAIWQVVLTVSRYIHKHHRTMYYSVLLLSVAAVYFRPRSPIRLGPLQVVNGSPLCIRAWEAARAVTSQVAKCTTFSHRLFAGASFGECPAIEDARLTQTSPLVCVIVRPAAKCPAKPLTVPEMHPTITKTIAMAQEPRWLRFVFKAAIMIACSNTALLQTKTRKLRTCFEIKCFGRDHEGQPIKLWNRRFFFFFYS